MVAYLREVVGSEPSGTNWNTDKAGYMSSCRSRVAVLIFAFIHPLALHQMLTILKNRVVPHYIMVKQICSSRYSGAWWRLIGRGMELQLVASAIGKRRHSTMRWYRCRDTIKCAPRGRQFPAWRSCVSTPEPLHRLVGRQYLVANARSSSAIVPTTRFRETDDPNWGGRTPSAFRL